MNWAALFAGFAAGAVVGSPVGWLTFMVLFWFTRRKLAAEATRVAARHTAQQHISAALRLVKMDDDDLDTGSAPA